VHHDKVKLLVVGGPAFLKIIRHLFDGQPDFEVVGSIGGFGSLARKTKRLGPKLIIASVKPVGTNVSRAVRTIKNSSPLSKLILICSVKHFSEGARMSGADACLEPNELVRGLLPACKLALRRSSFSRPTID
jgi:hypothetical protein